MHYPRESIITSTIRSFFRSFAVSSVFTALMLLLFGLISLSPYYTTRKKHAFAQPSAKGQRRLLGLLPQSY